MSRSSSAIPGSALDAVEHFVTKMCDADWSWWPFLSLRPPKNVRMDTLAASKIAIVFGVSGWAVLGTPLVLLGFAGGRSIVALLILWAAFLILLIGFMFVTYRGSVGYFWNRRAKRLQRSENSGA